MVLELNLRPDSVHHLERFLNTNKYKELAENTMSFNRRLNEERKMRIPYIDGQTGVAQKHYDNYRTARERMPGRRTGQVYTYPQRVWRKKRYQYLQYFMLPKHLRYEPEPTNWSAGHVGGGGGGNVEPVVGHNEDSNGSNNNSNEKQWETIYEDDFSAPEPEPEPESDDSDFEFDGVRTKKISKTKKRREKEERDKKVAASKMPTKESNSGSRRRTHADNIPDSEKPFACDMCLARYKTRPGLTYHYNHSHKGHRSVGDSQGDSGYHLPEPEDSEHRSVDSPLSGSDSLDGSLGGGRQSMMGVSGLSGSPSSASLGPRRSFSPPKLTVAKPSGSKRSSDKTQSSGYCDFCLGDSNYNKKTMQPEELIACSECGRSGHPSCLQFTNNMMVSVRKYPWQCIECKTCSLCGTSENDDQLLFCDDCDRGYHMYCLVPPMKVAPEGSWSCQICVDTFHKK